MAILTLSFSTAPSDNVALQYAPNSIRLSDATQTQTVAGMNQLTTYLGNKNNVVSAISLVATFSAFDMSIDKLGITDRIAANAVSTAMAGVKMGDTKFPVTTVLNSARSLHNFAIGTYNPIASTLRSPKPSIAINASLTDALDKVKRIRKIAAEALSFSLNWDVLDSDELWTINNLSIDGKIINFDDLDSSPAAENNIKGSQTLLFEVALSLIKVGEAHRIGGISGT